jgi:uncharacterized protein (TIGR02646 family)
MIRRGNCPTSLQKNPDSFVASDYSKEDVKDELFKMQHQKCCYCERDLSELSSTERHVDHYVPQSEFDDQNGNREWHLANRWENLLYSCPKCNSSKSNQVPVNPSNGAIEIINPSDNTLDPEDHITFEIDEVLIYYTARNGSQVGASTIENLKFCERTDVIAGVKLYQVAVENCTTQG